MTEAKKNIVLKSHENIVKGAQDVREYRGLELTNGLRILLVSDPTTDQSAVALDVKVGSFMDPWEIPGLAHLCDHMLFMGTAKYPSENEYCKFLASHAGESNAYTGTDYANYHFDVQPEQLPGAIDRFVQFFLSPLFTESATEREVCAVDSEHKNILNNDSRRVKQVYRYRSKPGYDFGKFGTGTYEFDAIENKKVTRKVWNDPPYGPEQLGKKVEAVPIKDSKWLSISFPFPDLDSEYKSQPGYYISHLIQHEAPGSLLSELKRRGWVSELESGFHTPASALLTEDPRQGAPMSLAINAASKLRYIPFEDILSSSYLLTKYDPERIKELLDKLTPANMYVRVVARKFKGQEGSTIEPIFGTEFIEKDIDEVTMQNYENALKTSHPAFRLPKKNGYIATNFDQKPREPIKSGHPRLIVDDSWSRVWFKQDDEYNMPKQEIRFVVTCPVVYQDPRSSLLFKLWLSCLGDILCEETYYTDLANLNGYVEYSLYGVEMKVNGYNEKQYQFTKDLTKRMVNL
ncbi:hypothetical protein L3Y34_006572 [Caenorhabditis briggsae]|uniref:Insulin-degrading enzyme n=1 Tax=Caenorhabditis briggsae TaxID=6238 RepID=A0AAE8ZZS9_CAEBR|nr:hypothetical protein L3Y34_006572 [Caenorhabditis briggsae]